MCSVTCIKLNYVPFKEDTLNHLFSECQYVRSDGFGFLFNIPVLKKTKCKIIIPYRIDIHVLGF